MSLGELIDAVMAHSAGRPIWQVMRDDEAAAGRSIILPGSEPWLSADDWDATITVSRDGKEVRLVAILAKLPGNGAFRRTVSGILGAGLVPVIIAPAVLMRETMKRWGWAVRHVGSGWDHEEQWRPRKGWRPS